MKYVIPLAIALGFSFHVHFTSIFYIPILLLSLPLVFLHRDLFKRRFRVKRNIAYILLAILIFLVWFVPHMQALLTTKNSYGYNIVDFFQSSYHGVHLVRIIQVAPDAFIEFDPLLSTIAPALTLLKYILPVLFALVFAAEKLSKERLVLLYLMMLWFLVPWFGFSVYKGEISNYYFSLTRPFVLIMLSYLALFVLTRKPMLPKIVLIGVLTLFTYQNMQQFFTAKYQGIRFYKEKMLPEAKSTKIHEFTYGAAESYLFFYYRNKLFDDPW